MVAESSRPNRVTPFTLKYTQVFTPPLKKMTASSLVIIMSDEEDACIHEHKIALERAKEERQRQREEEAQRAEEAERVRREAEAKKAWRDVEAKEALKMAEAEEAQ